MNTRGPRNIRREYVEAFIVAELERPPLGVRRDALPLDSAALQLAGRRERGRGHHSWPRCDRHRSRGKHVPMLSDDHVRLLLADCLGRDFRNRRDCATIRPFLDSGMRLAKTPPDIDMWNMVSEGLLAVGVLPYISGATGLDHRVQASATSPARGRTLSVRRGTCRHPGG